MRIEWDATKSARNWEPRGFDFAFASAVFDQTYVEFEDTHRDYGERRLVAAGIADGIPITVVFADRIDPAGLVVRRLISARVSNRKERRRYAQSVQEAESLDEGPR